MCQDGWSPAHRAAERGDAAFMDALVRELDNKGVLHVMYFKPTDVWGWLGRAFMCVCVRGG